MEIKSAIIKSASISSADHGLLSAWVHLDYGGSGQGFGGYNLYTPDNAHKSKNYAGHFVWRVLEIAGVDKWEDLMGCSVRVKGDMGGIKEIGHILNDDWFCPSKDFKEMEENKDVNNNG